jgi:PBP1b-binding outer membrane lipoprotein LpoB
MKKTAIIITVILLSALLSACASKETVKKGEADAKKPVNCATAEGDIRVLKSEKVHASQQMAAGVTALVPVGLVVNVAKGTEGSQAKVATGDYNKMLDDKIAEIKKECGVR